MSSVGVDLAGSPDRQTGICSLVGTQVKTAIAFHDQEILNFVESAFPEVVSIDAPLALPFGKTLDSKRCLRKCDEELLKMGIRFFPINFAGMRQLTERGIWMRKRLEVAGYKVIETYPGAAYELLGLPRPKGRGKRREVRKHLVELFHISGMDEKIGPHELDAVTCAIVGRLYIEGKAVAIGDPAEVLMILPRRRTTSDPSQDQKLYPLRGGGD